MSELVRTCVKITKIRFYSISHKSTAKAARYVCGCACVRQGNIYAIDIRRYLKYFNRCLSKIMMKFVSQ